MLLNKVNSFILQTKLWPALDENVRKKKTKAKMSVIKFRIILDRKDAIYLSGERIKGVVELETELDLKRCYKHVELHGICQCEWQKSSSKLLLKRKKTTFTRNDKFYTNWCYFDERSGFEKEANHVEAVTSSVSKNHRLSFNFQFQTIRQLPTSCITRDARILYKIKFYMSNVKSGGKYSQQPDTIEHDQPITIIRTLNPNGMHLYEKAWLLEVKPLLKCRLNNDCFVPGQNIHFVLMLENQRILWFIKSIVIELQEIQYNNGAINTHTLDSKHYSDIKYKQELLKKHETVQYFDNILTVPTTTVPSSNYPIYPQYTRFILLHIFHGINIIIKPRHKCLQLYRKKSFGKLITVGTQPMKTNAAGIEPLRQQDDILMDSNNYKCLASENGAMMQAYIPKYALTETVLNVE